MCVCVLLRFERVIASTRTHAAKALDQRVNCPHCVRQRISCVCVKYYFIYCSHFWYSILLVIARFVRVLESEQRRDRQRNIKNVMELNLSRLFPCHTHIYTVCVTARVREPSGYLYTHFVYARLDPFRDYS